MDIDDDEMDKMNGNEQTERGKENAQKRQFKEHENVHTKSVVDVPCSLCDVAAAWIVFVSWFSRKDAVSVQMGACKKVVFVFLTLIYSQNLKM